jgi:hypothetical protein
MEPLPAVVSQQQYLNMGKVTVYRFRRFSPATGESYPSQIYATREAINRFDAAIMDGTAIEVDAAEISDTGCYNPIPYKVQIPAFLLRRD